MDARILLKSSNLGSLCSLSRVLPLVGDLTKGGNHGYMRAGVIILFAFVEIIGVTITPQLLAATYKTDNFTVHAADDEFARRVGDAVEEYRESLAILWLGRVLPRWSSPCVVSVRVGKDLLAGGETVFSFSDGEVYDWKMRVQGSSERILDSVLPHEVTHTIIASYLRGPAPRWLDEGMATSVEADAERLRYRTMLVTFLHTKRGIAFNEMIAMKEYPEDLTPFYSQSFSICEYLIAIGGYRRLAEFAKSGSRTNDWKSALKLYYNCDSLGALQMEWVDWVRKWDVADRPAVLPETRKLPLFDDTNAYAATQRAKPSSHVLGEMRNWRHLADNQRVDSSLITRGQTQRRDSGLLQGFVQQFGGFEDTEDRWRETSKADDYSQKENRKTIVQTSPNGTVWRSGENLLSNGAGSASNAVEKAPDNDSRRN